MFIILKNDETYPNNTNSNFIYQLDEPLAFTDHHEVALVECYFNYDYTKSYGKLRWTSYGASQPLKLEAINLYYEKHKKYDSKDQLNLVHMYIQEYQRELDTVQRLISDISDLNNESLAIQYLNMIKTIGERSYSFLSEIGQDDLYSNYDETFTQLLASLRTRLEKFKSSNINTILDKIK